MPPVSSTLDRWGRSAVAGGDFAVRWRAAARALCMPAAAFALLWALCSVPGARMDGARGWAMVAQAAMHPFMTVALLLPLVAAVGARRVPPRERTAALVAAALAAAGLANALDTFLLIKIGVWPAPPWSQPVLWWANFGESAAITAAAVLVHDHRSRARARATVLREARARASDVVRRTAEARLQATQARIDPRFLFDALSAVERIHDADAAAGQRLLDDLVTYLRAVMPDLERARSTLAREIEVARLWLDVRRQVVGAPGSDTIRGDDPGASERWFPSAVLRTLADVLLAGAPADATLAIDVHCEGTVTVVHAVASTFAANDGALIALRDRLQELYGGAVRLSFDPGQGGATLEADDEEPARRHR